MLNKYVTIPLIALFLLGAGLINHSYGQSDEKAMIHIIGADFQKDPKLEIFFNNKRIGFLTKGLQIDYTIHQMGELVIMTQAYNMIDAKYGPPVQLKLNIENGKTYYLSAKYTPKKHLTEIQEGEVDKLTKGGKKILSTIELSDK